MFWTHSSITVLGVCWCVYLSQLTILYRLKGRFWMSTHWGKMWWLEEHCAHADSVGGKPFPLSVWVVSASGLAKHSPFQPDCFQPSLVLLAVQLSCCTLLRVLSNGLLEWVKKVLKYYQDSAWLLDSPLVLYLRPLRVLWLSGLKLEHC